MQTKSSHISENEPVVAGEPVAAYKIRDEISSPDRWNPNVPFHGTQEEWWEHFHNIEKGNFMTIEEADKEFEIWERELLASRM